MFTSYISLLNRRFIGFNISPNVYVNTWIDINLFIPKEETSKFTDYVKLSDVFIISVQNTDSQFCRQH